MKILMLGDVVGQHGCSFLRQKLPGLKKEYGAEIVIVNGENSAEGNGILPSSAEFLWDSGVDVITTGNHALRRREIYELLDSGQPILRPANFHAEAPGSGIYTLDMLRFKLCIINLQGTVYMNNIDNPFDVADRLIQQAGTKNIIVDFHAEATSEKLAMGFYLDGRVTAVAGTHTHVQTADERILPGGTGYITDLGMCGSFNSVLGVKPELAIKRMRTNLPVRFENDKGDCILSGLILEIDEILGKTTKIERINIK